MTTDFYQIIQLLKSKDPTSKDLAFEIIKGRPDLQDEFQKIFLESYKDSKDKIINKISKILEYTWFVTPYPLPPYLKCFDHLTQLNIRPKKDDKKYNEFLFLPKWIHNLDLKWINIYNYKIDENTFKQIAKFSNMRWVELSKTKLNSIPKEAQFMRAKNITFRLSNNNIQNADALFLNPNTSQLKLLNNPINSIPPAPKNTSLEELSITITKKNLQSFLNNIESYKNLNYVFIHCNRRIDRKLDKLKFNWRRALSELHFKFEKQVPRKKLRMYNSHID